jgi:6-phosphogluconolactonase
VTAAEVLVHATSEEVVETLAARLIGRLVDLQRNFQTPQLCLTGGRIASRAYQRLAADGARSAVDWSRVDLWWGDERFVPADDGERNAKQALDVLQPALPLTAERVHPMAASDGDLGLDDAAEAYAAELGETVFDVCLLGLGPDGHVASVFPEHPSSYAEGAVIPIRASPKPPPERISLTLAAINRSREVWFVVTGADKAAAANLALRGAGPVQIPGAGAQGRNRTLWLLDREAASQLPADLLPRGLL